MLVTLLIFWAQNTPFILKGFECLLNWLAVSKSKLYFTCPRHLRFENDVLYKAILSKIVPSLLR